MVKMIHISMVILSGSLFFLRGLGSLYGSRLMRLKFVRIAPHVIDTILLITAVILCIQIQQYPFVHHWITVKVFVLIIYIILGMVAIKRGKTKRQRAVAFVAAMLAFLFIVSVARTHDPLGALHIL